VITFFKKIFGIGPAADYKTLIKEGAQIIDVRTKAEYAQGHIRDSVNIPLNNLSNHYAKMKKDAPVITCCASGVRSAQAKSILSANGFTRVYNGGGWMGLRNKIG
jgi:rhodanese-related sulfurtransferase